MRVLVTGGCGFIGSHIVDALVGEGYDVSAIDNLSTGSSKNINPKARFYKMDIRDSCLMDIFMLEKPEAVIHSAAQVSVVASMKKPLEDASINILGSLNLLEAAKHARVRRIVYSSSAAVFGEPRYLPMDEEHPLEMLSAYGVTKHIVERYLAVYNRLYGIGYAALRYSNVYGPRQNSTGEGGVIAIFCDRLAKSLQPVIYGDGSQTRNFVYVKDVVNANLLALKSDRCGIYNVCSDQCVSINELLMILNELLGTNIKAEYAKNRESDIRHSNMSYEKIKKELKWEPCYDIVEGLKDTLEYNAVEYLLHIG